MLTTSLVLILAILNCIESTNVFRFEPIVILEEPPIGHLVLDLAQKLDIKDLATSDYKFRFYSPQSLTSHYFLIDQLTGHVKTQRTIDREYLCENKVCGPCTATSNCSLPIEIVATQSQAHGHKVQKFVSFDVIIEDKNEFAPKFTNEVLILNVSEGAPVNFSIPIEPAVDRDSHQARIRYTIVPIDDKSPTYKQELERLNSKIKLDETLSSEPQLNLIITEPFDYEQEKEVRFKIEASDGPPGPKTLTGNCLVILKIIDINDNLPVFDRVQYEYRLDEDRAIAGTRLIRVHASDKDDGLNGLVKYSLDQNENFQIDEITGWISVVSNLDYEKSPSHRFTVKAQDSGLTNSMPVYATCIIYLNDINDNYPQINITLPNSIDDFNTNLSLSLNNEIELSEWTMANTFIVQLMVSDKDSGLNGKVVLDMKEKRKKTSENKIEESNDFGLVHLFNNIYSIMLRQGLDREQYDLYLINITASDLGQPKSLSTSLQLTVRIKDENDNKPEFLIIENKTLIENNRVVGYEFILDELIGHGGDEWVDVGQVKAIDVDLEKNGVVSYSINGGDGNFRVDEFGIIQARAKILDREMKEMYTFEIIAGDFLNIERVNVTVKLNDLNDNQPRFEKNVYKYQIYENYLSSDEKPFARIRAHDLDKKESNFSTVRYSLMDRNDYFRIESKTGDLYQIKEFDYEKMDFFEFRVLAYDNFNTTPSLNSTCIVRVEVIDLNDNTPKVKSPTDSELPLVFSINSFLINESLDDKNKIRVKLTSLIAYDLDSGSNSILKFHIEKQIKLKTEKNFGQNDVDIFKIDPKTGVLSAEVLRSDKDDRNPGVYGLVVNISDSSESNAQSIRFYLFIILARNSTDEFRPQIEMLKSILKENSLNTEDLGDYDYELEDKIEDGKFYNVISQFENTKSNRKRVKINHLKQNNKNPFDKLFDFIDFKNSSSLNYILGLIVSIFVFLLVLITSLCLFAVYYKRVKERKNVINNQKKSLCDVYTDGKKIGYVNKSPPSSLTSSEFINLNSNRSSTDDDEDETGGFHKPTREEERAILIVNTSATDTSHNLASTSTNSTHNQLLVLVSSPGSSNSEKKNSSESLTSTTISRVSNNFKTFKNSNPNSESSSPKQTVLVANEYSNSYRTLPVNRNVKYNKTFDPGSRQLNLPVNELFKRYELKKQATNGLLDSTGSLSSLNSFKKCNKKDVCSPKLMPRSFNLNPIINITTNENNEIPDYFFKDEKEHRMFQSSQSGNGAKNNKILNLKQIVVDSSKTSSACTKTDL